MSQIDPLDRALGILSSAINKQLGVSNLVSRRRDRAYRSGEIKMSLEQGYSLLLFQDGRR